MRMLYLTVISMCNHHFVIYNTIIITRVITI